MKLSDIITRVQRQFGDDIQAQITTDDIIRWVNDACLEIVTNNNTNEGYQLGTTPVVAGQRAYELPADLLRLRSIRVNGLRLNGSTYDQLSEVDAELESTVGIPTAYWVYGGELNLYPVPSDNLGNLTIMYVKTPDKMTDVTLDREPDVPQMYHPRIVEYCIAQAAELDDNLGQYQLKMGQFRQNMQSLSQNGEQPESDSVYPSITFVNDGW